MYDMKHVRMVSSLQMLNASKNGGKSNSLIQSLKNDFAAYQFV